MNFMQSLGIKNNILVNKKSMNKFIKGKNIVLVPTFWDHCQISLYYFQLTLNLVIDIFNLLSFWIQIWVCFSY